nr:DUF4283 domain-containing protein [Ipomoea batatas]
MVFQWIIFQPARNWFVYASFGRVSGEVSEVCAIPASNHLNKRSLPTNLQRLLALRTASRGRGGVLDGNIHTYRGCWKLDRIPASGQELFLFIYQTLFLDIHLAIMETSHKKTTTEVTCSRTLGSTDTYSTAYVTENLGESSHMASKEKDLWANLFKENKDTLGASAALKYFPPVNGNAQLEFNEILTIKERWGFGLLGSFAGRFPGAYVIQSLVNFWKINCKFFTQPNGHVLFRFQSEEDRCAILKNGPYFLFGKRLFLKSLPEKFRLENEDFSTLPIWVRFPFLPIECWSPTALGKIGSCIGIPICADERTREQRIGREECARVLIDIDTSKRVPDSVLVNMPDGNSFRQKVTFEINPCYCTKCNSNDHFKEECTGIKPWAKKRGKKAKVTKQTATQSLHQNKSANKEQDTSVAVLEDRATTQEPCPQASPCTDSPAKETSEQCTVLASNPPSSKETDDQVLDNASPEKGDENPQEDTQSGTGDVEEESDASSLDGADSDDQREDPKDNGKKPVASESHTAGMGTRSKTKSGPKTSFKNALLSPPKDKRDSALFKKIFEARDKISLAKGGLQNAKEFLHNSVNNNKFQVSQVYDLLREKSQPAFAWRFVWRSYIPRKFSFITWLAIHQRLPTKDRLAFLDINTDCSMCVGDKETAQHLFFKCPFSLHVWNEVRMHFGFHKCTNAIRSSIKWINRLHGGARPRSKAITIALICTIYHLWRNRNRVHHDEDRLPINGLVKNIAKDVYRVIFYLYPTT